MQSTFVPDKSYNLVRGGFYQLSTFLVTLIAFKNFVEMKFIFVEAFIHNFVTFIAWIALRSYSLAL